MLRRSKCLVCGAGKPAEGEERREAAGRCAFVALLGRAEVHSGGHCAGGARHAAPERYIPPTRSAAKDCTCSCVFGALQEHLKLWLGRATHVVLIHVMSPYCSKNM